MPLSMMHKLFLLVAMMLAHPVHAARTYVATVTYVTDGDTLWVQPASGGQARKLRIEGIDAPEICQAGGEDAKAMLMQQTLHQRVEVTVKRKDVYGRGLARVRLMGQDVGAQMVLSGYAWSYRWHRSLGPYASEESAARAARRGVFAAGQVERPGDFRKRHGSCYDKTW
jgi:micrococcal nuclease